MSQAVHVLPVNDLREHSESIACECRPRVEQYDSHSLVIHNSWDGREITEQAVDATEAAGAMN